MYAQVLGISVDSVPCLVAWAKSLGGITYPLLSDFFPHGEVAQRYGVLREDGRSERALFIVDKQGIVRYVDVHDIDDQPDNEELFRVLAELEPEAAAALAAAEAQAQPAPTGDVVMYCTPWCPTCPRARAYLEKRGIEYVEVDISRDRAAAQRVRGWADGNETTPTFDIKGTIVVDFDQAKLDQVFGVAE
jgi:glutaredoxin